MFFEHLETRRLLASTITSFGTEKIDKLFAVGSTLYYTSNDGGRQLVTLYANNGSATASVELSRAVALTERLAEFNGKLVYRAPNGSVFDFPGHLRVSNGTIDGTRPTEADRFLGDDFDPSRMVRHRNNYYAVASDPEDVRFSRLLRFSSTQGGFDQLARFEEFPIGSPSIGVNGVANVGNRLFFLAGDLASRTPAMPVTLWTSDGTSAATRALRSFERVEIASDNFLRWQAYVRPENGASSTGAALFFAPDDGINGMELWRSDRTVDGTTRVTQLGPGSESADPHGLGYMGGKFIFLDTTSTSHEGLYATDGTTDGTIKLAGVTGFHTGFEGIGSQAIVVRDRLFFVGNENELWTTDGTIAGTQKIFTGDRLRELVKFRNEVYFLGFDADRIMQVYRSDGTSANTIQTIEFPFARTEGDRLDTLTVAGRALYMVHDDFPTQARTLHRIADTRTSIGGVAFADTNIDGFRDRAEPATVGATVFLDENDNGAFDDGELSTLTDSLGRWSFVDIAAGTYVPTLVLVAGTRATTVRTDVTLAAGDHATVNLGSAGNTSAIVGRVQEDFDANRKMGFGDAGIPQVNVQLDLNRNNKLERTDPIALTDDTGRYHFNNVAPGTYSVFLLSHPQWIPSTATRTTVTVSANTVATVRSFGVGAIPSVSGAIEIADTGERIRTPVKLFLDYDQDGRLDSDEVITFSDKKGRFRFSSNAIRLGLQEIRVAPGEDWELHPTLNLAEQNFVNLGFSDRFEGILIFLQRA